MSNLPKVQLRGGFSERNKIREENQTLQFKDFDTRTRVAFCNAFQEAYIEVVIEYGKIRGNSAGFEQMICKEILEKVYCVQVDKNCSYNVPLVFDKYIYRTIKEDNYNAVLDLIDFFAKYDELLHSYFKRAKYIKERFNKAFEYDFVGYRFVGDKIVAITDENEIAAIEEAIVNNPYIKSKEHFDKALALLSDRNNKDYANSIKESICAVENICQIIVEQSDSLGKALDQLEKKGIKINKTLKDALKKMYGYTTDSGGIRHANAFNDEVPTFEDAKYMLVVCAAFVNYLIAKMAQIK